MLRLYWTVNQTVFFFVLTGDLNTLNMRDLQTQFGFEQMVNLRTDGGNILDLFITNRPDMFNVQVEQSLISTKHKAIITNAKSIITQTGLGAHRKSIQISDYMLFSSNLLRP